MKTMPPLNYRIWVTANNYTWFPIRIMYMSETAVVYKNLRANSQDRDIACSHEFDVVFCDWKITLDGTEKEISR